MLRGTPKSAGKLTSKSGKGEKPTGTPGAAKIPNGQQSSQKIPAQKQKMPQLKQKLQNDKTTAAFKTHTTTGIKRVLQRVVLT